MKFSMIFEGVDKASKVMKKIMATEKKTAAAIKGNSTKAASSTARVQRANSALSRSMDALKRSSGNAFRAISSGADKAGRAIKSLHQKTVALGKRGFDSIKDGTGKIGRGVAVATGIVASIYGSAALAAGSLVDIGSQFENFQVQLTALEGSSAGAEMAMNWITDFATRTPLELDQVVESFASLRTFGLDPTNGTMQALVDTMAMSGKGADHLSGLTLALGQAWTKGKLQGEEALQLIERGVPVWDLLGQKYGKTAEQLQKMASKGQLGRGAIQDLITLMGERAAGASDKMSKTWAGMTSNMADHWQQFQTMILNAGLFEWMKGKLRSILDVIDQMKADGALQEWATKIGQSIQTALESAWTTATRLVEVGGQVGDFLSKAAEWAGGWDNLAIALGAVAFAPTLVATAQGIIMIAKGIAMLSAALMANPVGLAIAAIAAGAYLIYANWDAVKPYFVGIWNGIKAAAETAWNWIKTAFSWTPLGVIIANWSGISEALAAPIRAGKKMAVNAWTAIKGLFDWSPSFSDWTLPTLDTALLESAWETVKATFDNWTPDFGSWSLPSLDTSAITATWDTIKGLFDWSPLEALDRTFGGIPGKIGRYLSEAAEMAGVAWNKLKSVFSDDAAVDIAARDPASIERATAAANRLEGALTSARAVDMSGVSASISSLIAQASGLTGAVKQSVASAQSFLAGVSFHHHGVRMMDTLAAGMRARAQVVVEQIRATMQQVRNHLPSSPAKVGPLSDIHRLKFGETIAASIKADPMVRAMRAAAAATMAAALPVTAATAMPSVTAQSALPVAASARSATAAGYMASTSGGGGGAAPINITYSPTIHLSGEAQSAEASFRKMLETHKRDIKRMVDEEMRRESRRKH